MINIRTCFSISNLTYYSYAKFVIFETLKRVSTTVPNKIYLKESWIASLSLAMTILKIRNVIAKECICTTVAIHFCYLILFYFIVLLYVYIGKRVQGAHELFV